ncbi:hypothetical protein [Mesonia sp. K7]|uniref:hypothetical protein n=1 Tax=Mesonia sp. K7 TaxID=2218606 RepID=UPI000DAA70D9|nr:hypothetical protein [Mesonia sp. K7]PZD76691.1 hypothetical protein DNG35_11070 [Mesonia sp. K7]
MEEKPLLFKKKGFPTIRVFDKYFEIKAVDYWEFRVFEYAQVKDIIYYDPNKKWWNKLYILTSFTAQIFAKDDPWILKVIKANGGDWDYKISPISDPYFRKVIGIIKNKINKDLK